MKNCRTCKHNTSGLKAGHCSPHYWISKAQTAIHEWVSTKLFHFGTIAADADNCPGYRARETL